MAEIQDLTTVDASNTARFPENQAPSTVNDGARALEGLVARWHRDLNTSVTTGGTSTEYTYAANQTLSAYFDGMFLGVDFHTACGATPTIDVDSIGAKDLIWPDGTQLAANDVATDSKALIVYDGTSFQVISVPGTPVTLLWDEIGTATASNDSSVDFTWAGTVYKKVILIINKALPVDDGDPAFSRTTTNATDFDEGGSDYKWSWRGTTMETTEVALDNGDDASSLIELGIGDGAFTGNAANRGWSGTIEVLMPAEIEHTSINFWGNLIDENGLGASFNGSGLRLSAADVDGIRFLFASSNINTGEFVCYGLK